MVRVVISGTPDRHAEDSPMRRLYAFLPVCIALTGLPAGGCTRETPLGASLSTPGVPFASSAVHRTLS